MINHGLLFSLREVQLYYTSRVSGKHIDIQAGRHLVGVNLYQTTKRPWQVPAFILIPPVSPRQPHHSLYYSFFGPMTVQST